MWCDEDIMRRVSDIIYVFEDFIGEQCISNDDGVSVVIDDEKFSWEALQGIGIYFLIQKQIAAYLIY